MLKQLFNELRFKVVIETIDPLLIKSGKLSITGPDSNPVMTLRKGRENLEPFIPGSSLKGVFRSHLEKVIKTVDIENKTLVCIPYEVADKSKKRSTQSRACDISCGEKFAYRQKKKEEKEPPPPSEMVYKDSCPICRLFGSVFFKGRITISDGYLTPEGRETYGLETRDGVAIDRFTGGAASRAKFAIEVVINGEFETTVTLRNFEIWQLGLLGILLTDLQNETIQLGSGTSRGLGRIKGEVKDVVIRMFRTLECNSEIWGIGKCLDTVNPEAVKQYGLFTDDSIAFSLPEAQTNGAYKQYNIKEDTAHSLFKAGADHCFKKISTWNTPQKMKFDEEVWKEY